MNLLRSTKRGVLPALAVAALVSGACGGSTPREARPGAAKAPDFTVETFDGETFSLAEHRGTPVVVNFWESW